MAPLAETMKKLKQIEDIPTLPVIVTKVLDVANSSNSTANDLNNVIIQDQSLTSKTLKLVNSAYYGFPRTVTKITEAIVILGFNAVKNLALSVSVCELFNKSDIDFDRKELWKHSVGVAVATGIIAKKSKMTIDHEELFITGLLHDIGLIICDQYLHDDFIISIKEAAKENVPIEVVEKEIYGMDHAMIGKKVTESWKLPSKICTVIGFHHQPQYAYADSKKDTAVVYLADLICKLKKFGFDGDRAIPKLRMEPFMTLGIQKNDIKEISALFDEEIKKAKDFLTLVDN
ncbi:MAG: HDOD domain-containing protein [Candidatus Muiribacteriota bacterium]|jgi:HD-like signal output (HDOD) protein